jgi:hypothetical protein
LNSVHLNAKRTARLPQRRSVLTEQEADDLVSDQGYRQNIDQTQVLGATLSVVTTLLLEFCFLSSFSNKVGSCVSDDSNQERQAPTIE